MKIHLILSIFLFFGICEAALPDLSPETVTAKAREIMKAHASEKQLNPKLARRILVNYIENLDPLKTYFIASDIDRWLSPSDELVCESIEEYNTGRFTVFEEIDRSFREAIVKRRSEEKTCDMTALPSGVQSKEFKDIAWAQTRPELIDRLRRIRALQAEAASTFTPEMKELSARRILKRQTNQEDEYLNPDPDHRRRQMFCGILKATASSLDTHSVYFTPDEANRFMVHVRQCLCGIGALLRDDINGLTITKMVEGGPAILGKQLKNKDRIVAVNGEPIVGMDIEEAVDLIRGKAKTPVTLTIVRESPSSGDKPGSEETLEFTLLRDEILLKDFRYKCSYEPFGDRTIGYLKLHSFYRDQDSSSYKDLKKALIRLKKEHDLAGLILDLRYNTGGLLDEAASIASLFIPEGIVVSVKNENGRIHRFRNHKTRREWDGPLIILVNRMSASASEIVAQTVHEYRKCIIVGDDRTFGKGSYQTFAVSTDSSNEDINPEGEFKVTRGRYYTVSGKTPQLEGVKSDIIVPSPLSESEIGERFYKYPLEQDFIEPGFEEDISDIPFLKGSAIRKNTGTQTLSDIYTASIETLRSNSSCRLERNRNYANFLKEIKKEESQTGYIRENFGQSDLQLEEAYAIMKDLILIVKENDLSETREEPKNIFSPCEKEPAVKGCLDAR